MKVDLVAEVCVDVFHFGHLRNRGSCCKKHMLHLVLKSIFLEDQVLELEECFTDAEHHLGAVSGSHL